MKEVIEAIKNNLTTDLLPRTWLSRNAVQKMAGHCYHASCVLQNYYPELELHRAVDDEGEYHWFCRSENDIIDIIIFTRETSQQWRVLIRLGRTNCTFQF